MTLTAELARRALEPPDAAARDHLRMLTLGNVGAAAGPRGAAGLLIDRLGAPADGAHAAHAWRWGATLHARTQDDFFPSGRVHVGAVTLAAALALDDAVGDRLLDCLAAGYDVLCRVSAAYGHEAQRRGMRPSGIFGPLGAAATAAVALGLDEDGVANALGLAAAASAGTNQSWISGSDEWLLVMAAAARAGVEAAVLTAAGAVAAPDALEGEAGWSRALFADDGGRALATRLELEGSGLREVARKLYPVSGIAQVPTWLACELHGAIAGSTVGAVELAVCPAEAAYPGSANRGPFRSRSSALMSLAFGVACGLTDGHVGLDRLERRDDAGIDALVQRVEVQPRVELDEAQAVLVVEVDGRRLERRGSAEDILWPAWDALDAGAVATACEADPALLRAARDELARDAPDVRALRGLLTGDGARAAVAGAGA